MTILAEPATGEQPARRSDDIIPEQAHPATAIEPGSHSTDCTGSCAFNPCDANAEWQRQEAVKATGIRTIFDLPTDPPAPPMLDGWLHPTGTTIIYGKGGVGKGITSAWLMLRLVRELGHKVLIVDFESHPDEYGSRLTHLGLTAEENNNFRYVAPYMVEWTERKGNLFEIADAIKRAADSFGATYLLVDSYTTAAPSDDAMGGQSGADQMQRAFARIGRPALLLAHVTKGSQRHPEYPFGSVHIHNLVARRTWSIEKDGDEKPDPNDRYAPTITRMEFRNNKANNGSEWPDKKLAFSFYMDGSITATLDDTKPRTLSDMVLHVLARGDDRTSRQIATAILETFDERPTEEVVRKTLRRLQKAGTVTVNETGTPFRWNLPT